MKIAIGYRPQAGPWGGGNRFVIALEDVFRRVGHSVCHTLDHPDIDIILIIDPRRRNPSVTFSPADITRYLLFSNPEALVVHRINECDERKNTHFMNRLLRNANYCADHTVFVGNWLRDLNVWQNRTDAKSSVIKNGADPTIFNSISWQPWPGSGPLKLVTHHWGGNWMKGFDIYQRLDSMLCDPVWSDRITFTYIGNLPRGFSFRNARYIPPLDGEALAQELRNHHAYVTASINEPGGNHQNEGALCGLPLLYRRSGCLPEYCDGFGVSFDESDFVQSLILLIATYHSLVTLMPRYPHNSDRTCQQYLTLFEYLLRSKKHIIASRNLFLKPCILLRNLIVA